MSSSAFSSPNNSNNIPSDSNKYDHGNEKIHDELKKEDDMTSTDDRDEVPLLGLPPSNPDKPIPTLQFGEKMAFDHLGPIIINADGSTRQIANWDEMTEQEQKVTWRRISKRNEERRAALKKRQEEEMKAKQDKEED